MVISIFKHKGKKGFIAILSLLIVATISMIISMSLLKDGVDNASLSLYSIYYENAKINSVICLEDTLLRIKLEDQFNKNLDYVFSEGQGCNTSMQWYTPQQTGPGTVETLVDLTVTGTSQNFTRSFIYDLMIRKHDVNYLDGSIEYVNNINIISIEEITT